MTDDYTPATNNVDLAGFDDEFEGLPEEPESDDIPDGKYQVRIDGFEITRSKSSGNPMLKWKLRIIAPRCVGRILWRNAVLRNDPDSLRWTKKDLATVGVRISKLSDLPQHVDSIIGRCVEVSKTTRGEYESIYLNKLIEMDDPGEGGSGAVDDTLPF